MGDVVREQVFALLKSYETYALQNQEDDDLDLTLQAVGAALAYRCMEGKWPQTEDELNEWILSDDEYDDVVPFSLLDELEDDDGLSDSLDDHRYSRLASLIVDDFDLEDEDGDEPPDSLLY